MLDHQRILSPPRVLGSPKVLGPHRVLGPLRVLGPVFPVCRLFATFSRFTYTASIFDCEIWQKRSLQQWLLVSQETWRETSIRLGRDFMKWNCKSIKKNEKDHVVEKLSCHKLNINYSLFSLLFKQTLWIQNQSNIVC